ncbi:uncharacterized protein V6R79_025860 [Siganus canaliculatus]
MNLFCFTLEGSTESIYQPAHSHSLREVLPKYQCSPVLLRRRPEWGGSDPAINSDQPLSAMNTKKNNRRSCVPTSPLVSETLDKDSVPSCWLSSGEKRISNHSHLKNREMCPSTMLTLDEKLKDLKSDQGETQIPAQRSEASADTAESTQSTGRLRRLQNLVQTKRGNQSGAGKGKNTSEDEDDLGYVQSNNNPVLTCIGLGQRTEKKTSKAAPASQHPEPQHQQHQHQQQDREADKEGARSPRIGNYLWSPFECPQPWTPFYHTCHQPRHDLWVCGGKSSLPQATEWDRFESLIQELDSKQLDLSPLPAGHPDLQPPQTTSTRFGRFDAFRQQSPLMRAQDNGSSLVREAAPQSAGSASSDCFCRTPHLTTAGMKGGLSLCVCVQSGKARRDETGRRRSGGVEHRRSTNSLESLYSLNSGQSSSSGVTSGSDCSSNRNSVRLEDDLLCTRPFSGRARVHTEYVPSPYDSESLRLQVGDVIDIIATPPMGIWRGMLNGKIGNFKFIYVDMLTEEVPETHLETQSQRVREKSTVQEVLKHLSLEEYSLSLLLNGYQTVDDLMKLREHHLTELSVTDPEHRHRLLAAVDSLQQLYSDSPSESEAYQEAETPGKNPKADTSNCPRDSGCHMASDSPDHSSEDAELHFASQYQLAAEVTAS